MKKNVSRSKSSNLLVLTLFCRFHRQSLPFWTKRFKGASYNLLVPLFTPFYSAKILSYFSPVMEEQEKVVEVERPANVARR